MVDFREKGMGVTITVVVVLTRLNPIMMFFVSKNKTCWYIFEVKKRQKKQSSQRYYCSRIEILIAVLQGGGQGYGAAAC